MKSLKESLFDSDLVKKDIKFGDVYKPVFITCTNNNFPFKKISNMFNIGKLRKECKDKKLDLSAVPQNSHCDNRYLETIELITGIVSEFKLKSKLYEYDKDIMSTFSSLTRSPYWKRGIDITIGSHGSMFNDGLLPELYITKSNASEYTRVIIKYEKI